MSEYQFYEFQTIDQPLTDDQMAYVDSLSSRVELSATRAAFVYHYSSLRTEPKDLLRQCFDAYMYVANWGTRQLMFRFPKDTVDVRAMLIYEVEYMLEVHEIGDYVILEMQVNDEEGSEWIEDGDYQLYPFLPLRNAIIQGDYRSLYLIWLAATTFSYSLDIASQSPPIPPNLDKLDTPLKRAAEFFWIDPYLIEAAAKFSPRSEKPNIDFKQTISELTMSEKDAFLLRLVQGESLLQTKLIRRLQGDHTIGQPNVENLPTGQQLHDSAEELRQIGAKQAAATAEKNRIENLKALAKREDQTWQRVDDLISEAKAKSYDEAVALLVQLRDLASYQGNPLIFEQRISTFRKQYANRTALIRRFREKKL